MIDSMVRFLNDLTRYEIIFGICIAKKNHL